MKVTFKQAVGFNGKNYARGTFEVPEIVLQDSYFQSLKKTGLAIVEEFELSAETFVAAESEVEDDAKFEAEAEVEPKQKDTSARNNKSKRKR